MRLNKSRGERVQGSPEGDKDTLLLVKKRADRRGNRRTDRKME